MDTVVLVEKLESLRRCIRRIEAKKPDNADQLKQDIDLQDILVLNLTRAILLSVDIGSISSVTQIARRRKPWDRYSPYFRKSTPFPHRLAIG